MAGNRRPVFLSLCSCSRRGSSRARGASEIVPGAAECHSWQRACQRASADERLCPGSCPPGLAVWGCRPCGCHLPQVLLPGFEAGCSGSGQGGLGSAGLRAIRLPVGRPCLSYKFSHCMSPILFHSPVASAFEVLQRPFVKWDFFDAK